MTDRWAAAAGTSPVDTIRIPIREESDVAVARSCARALASHEGLDESGATAVAIAVSEVRRAGRRGVLVVARDARPGIPDVERAMRDGYSTGRGLGLGLAGARRLMDEFTLVSAVGEGTTVTMRKWAQDDER
jgi:anti-sigma regulatory factor (Ser/Thr protein kinase)